jgi:hypothetical protein
MNKQIEKLIETIITEADFSNEQRFKELENLLFKEFCLKQYLVECEPFYCTFRITSSCKYIEMLKEIKEKYGVDIVSRKIVR